MDYGNLRQSSLAKDEKVWIGQPYNEAGQKVDVQAQA